MVIVIIDYKKSTDRSEETDTETLLLDPESRSDTNLCVNSTEDELRMIT